MKRVDRYITYGVLALVGYAVLRQGASSNGAGQVGPDLPSGYRRTAYDPTLGLPITPPPLEDAVDFGASVGAYYGG